MVKKGADGDLVIEPDITYETELLNQLFWYTEEFDYL